MIDLTKLTITGWASQNHPTPYTPVPRANADDELEMVHNYEPGRSCDHWYALSSKGGVWAVVHTTWVGYEGQGGTDSGWVARHLPREEVEQLVMFAAMEGWL